MKKISKQAYTTEFKELAVNRVTGGESIAAVVKELGLGDQALRNWGKAAAQGKLLGAGSKAVTPEAMELYRLRAEGSMSRKGNCWESEHCSDAPAESWFNSFKNERCHGLRYATHAEMRAASFEYIEVFYNRIRQYSTLRYRSPMQYLDCWRRAQNQEKLTA